MKLSKSKLCLSSLTLNRLYEDLSSIVSAEAVLFHFGRSSKRQRDWPPNFFWAAHIMVIIVNFQLARSVAELTKCIFLIRIKMMQVEMSGTVFKSVIYVVSGVGKKKTLIAGKNRQPRHCLVSISQVDELTTTGEPLPKKQ